MTRATWAPILTCSTSATTGYEDRMSPSSPELKGPKWPVRSPGATGEMIDSAGSMGVSRWGIPGLFRAVLAGVDLVR